MNESTFEARTHMVIQQIFPSYADLELTHQHIFSVKVGHDEMTIKPHVKKPRLDILIKQKDRNLAVLELKKPSHPLTDDDRDQGLSYAGLLRPLPPLVIVSNGNQTRFYDTVTGEPLDLTSPDDLQLEQLFATALDIAADRRDAAIRTLLGKDPTVWEHVIERLNQRGFQNHIGTIDSLYTPISDSFLLPRESVSRIAQLVSGNNPVVVVTGAPLVGKTNVLYALCQLKDMPFIPLYINAEDCQYGILQHLANYFIEHFFTATSVDDVRHWLRHGIVNNRHPGGKIVLIIDGIRSSDQTLTREIDELIHLCSTGTSCSLVIACDSSTYTQMALIPGRPVKSLFGKRAMRVEIEKLNDNEFLQAKKYLIDCYAASFHNGAEYSKQLRDPRILRMMVSRLPGIQEDDIFLQIPSFLPFRNLDWTLRGFSDEPRFMDDMVKLVKASLEPDPDSSSNLLSRMVSYGRGHVPIEIAGNILGADRIDRLYLQGHVDWFEDKENNRYIMPKVPELLAAAAVEVLVRQGSKMGFKQAVDHILKSVERLPYGDLIAANAFHRLSCNTAFPLYDLILRLAQDPPQVKRVESSFKGAIYFDKTGLVDIPEELWREIPEEDSKMFSNLLPWLVLSQLATEPIYLDGSDDPWAVYRSILLTVGGYPYVLRRFDPVTQPENIEEYYTHSVRSKNGIEGEVLCGKVGIIEPITYAMQNGFFELPEEMLKICRYAVKKGDPFLGHRLHNAAKTMTDVTKTDSAKAAHIALQILKDVHKSF